MKPKKRRDSHCIVVASQNSLAHVTVMCLLFLCVPLLPFSCFAAMVVVSVMLKPHWHRSWTLLEPTDSFVMLFVCFCFCFCLFTFIFVLFHSLYVDFFSPLLVRLCAFVHLNSTVLHLEHVLCSWKMSFTLLLLQLLLVLLMLLLFFCCVLTWAGQIPFYSYGEKKKRTTKKNNIWYVHINI